MLATKVFEGGERPGPDVMCDLLADQHINLGRAMEPNGARWVLLFFPGNIHYGSDNDSHLLKQGLSVI